MANQYIRTDVSNRVIYTFWDFVEQPEPTDILYAENVSRDFSDLNLYDSFGRYALEWDGTNIIQHVETTAEKKLRLQGDWRRQRDILMKEADTWELPSYQKKYLITQAQVEAYKAQLYDVPTTIAKLEKPVWPTKPV